MLLAVLGLALVIVVRDRILQSAWWNYGVPPVRFDSTGWKAAHPIDNRRTIRSQMIGDLLRRYDFRGWSRAKIIELLGIPDWYPQPNWDLTYRLGLERAGPYSLDYEYLAFRLDRSGRVTGYRTIVD